MPMIDVYVPAGLLPDDGRPALLRALGHALLRAEGAPAAAPYLENTGVYLHELDAAAVATAGSSAAKTVRVEVLTPPGALDRTGQRKLVAEATELIATACGDATQAVRTWVLLREAAEGGWGVAGTALGADEFAFLRAQSAQVSS